MPTPFKTFFLAYRHFHGQGISLPTAIWDLFVRAAQLQADIEVAGTFEDAIILQRQREIAIIRAKYPDSPERHALLTFHEDGLRSDREFLAAMKTIGGTPNG